MAGRFLRAFKTISRFMPEIKSPERKTGFNEKIFWTILALAIYLVMAEVPLYGITAGQGWDLSSLRIIFASNKGTLMELGIGPIVTAGIILQLLGGSGMIEMDMNDPEDRGLFTGASKFFSIVLTGVQASAYLIGGVYGQLTPSTSLIVFLELLSAGVIVMLLDEMVQKGWGFGSGISLFILAGVAQGILWDMFSPAPLGRIQDGLGSLGIFVALAQALLSQSDVTKLFIRQSTYPGLLGFIATLAVFFIVIYAEGVRVELPVSQADYKGYRSRYPIKLLYVSNLPVIFASALFANVYFFAQTAGHDEYLDSEGVRGISVPLVEIQFLRLGNDYGSRGSLGRAYSHRQSDRFLHQCRFPLVVDGIEGGFAPDSDLSDESIHAGGPSAASGHGQHL